MERSLDRMNRILRAPCTSNAGRNARATFPAQSTLPLSAVGLINLGPRARGGLTLEHFCGANSFPTAHFTPWLLAFPAWRMAHTGLKTLLAARTVAGTPYVDGWFEGIT